MTTFNLPVKSGYFSLHILLGENGCEVGAPGAGQQLLLLLLKP